MTDSPNKSIRFPSHWKTPKYYLGQRVKQGEIVGLEYHPPGTQRAYELGEGWTYVILPTDYSEEVEIKSEHNIELLPPSESNKEIKELIDLYQNRIATLTEQLEVE